MEKIRSQQTKKQIRESRKNTAFRRKSQLVKCYELKLNFGKLNASQKEQLEMIFLEGKRFYNHILALKKNQNLRLQDINPSSIYEVDYLDKNNIIHHYVLQYLPSSCKQTIYARMISNEKTIRTLVSKGIQKHGQLQFKSELDCIPLKNIDWRIKPNNRIRISGIKKSILMHGIKQLPKDCEFANANLLHKPDGFYLYVTTYVNKENFKSKSKNGKDIGLDFGIKTTITTSEGEKIDISIGERDQTKALQKKLERQIKGSNNRWKTIKKLRISYQKTTNKKRDMANKFIHKMKIYDHVIFQDDDIHAWHSEKGNENKGKRRKVQNSCLGLIKAKLKLLDNSIIIAKFIPTTKFCRCCGSIKNDLKQEDRTYECHCGYVEDRDVHAAKNMVWIWKKLQEEHLVPMDGREVKLEDWHKFQDDPRRCSIFS